MFCLPKTALASDFEHVGPILAGAPYEIFVTSGSPATAIVETAREKGADLLVIGTHGHHGWRRALLGSVAESVLQSRIVAMSFCEPRSW